MEVEDRGLVLLDDTTGYAGFDTWFDHDDDQDDGDDDDDDDQDDGDDDDDDDERVVCYRVGNAGSDT